MTRRKVTTDLIKNEGTSTIITVFLLSSLFATSVRADTPWPPPPPLVEQHEGVPQSHELILLPRQEALQVLQAVSTAESSLENLAWEWPSKSHPGKKRMRPGVASATTAEYGVGKRYTS